MNPARKSLICTLLYIVLIIIGIILIEYKHPRIAIPVIGAGGLLAIYARHNLEKWTKSL